MGVMSSEASIFHFPTKTLSRLPKAQAGMLQLCKVIWLSSSSALGLEKTNIHIPYEQGINSQVISQFSTGYMLLKFLVHLGKPQNRDIH